MQKKTILAILLLLMAFSLRGYDFSFCPNFYVGIEGGVAGRFVAAKGNNNGGAGSVGKAREGRIATRSVFGASVGCDPDDF